MSACKYLDPTCPCQDGDTCHYEGDNPWSVPSDRVRAIIAATQEKCAQVADAYARHAAARLPNAQKCEDDIAICMLETEAMMSQEIASAIRALNLSEPNHG